MQDWSDYIVIKSWRKKYNRSTTGSQELSSIIRLSWWSLWENLSSKPRKPMDFSLESSMGKRKTLPNFNLLINKPTPCKASIKIRACNILFSGPVQKRHKDKDFSDWVRALKNRSRKKKLHLSRRRKNIRSIVKTLAIRKVRMATSRKW